MRSFFAKALALSLRLGEILDWIDLYMCCSPPELLDARPADSIESVAGFRLEAFPLLGVLERGQLLMLVFTRCGSGSFAADAQRFCY